MSYYYINKKEMERGFSLIKRMKNTDLYIAFSDMIFRYMYLNLPRFIGEKSFFIRYFPLNQRKSAFY
jgi:hypothetical protein